MGAKTCTFAWTDSVNPTAVGGGGSACIVSSTDNKVIIMGFAVVHISDGLTWGVDGVDSFMVSFVLHLSIMVCG